MNNINVMEEKDKLVEWLLKNNVSQNFIDAHIKDFMVRKYKKGTLILSVGERQTRVGFILKGIIRAYSLDKEGEDISKHFSSENSWVYEYSLLDGQPAEFFYEALEDCLVAEINVQNFLELINSDKHTTALFLQFSSKLYRKTEEKIVHFQQDNAKERYQWFLENYPDLERRINQEHIATYLGVTPSSLSRLKKEL
jgi:CRP-like cAMP-binding protein